VDIKIVQQHRYSNRGRTPSVKTLRGNIHDPNQRGHLEQFINAKEKDYKESLQESFSQSIIGK
jgi:hypothetical protein